MVGIKNQSLFLSKIQHRKGMYELYLENPNFLKPISNGGSQMLEKSKQLAQTWWLRVVLIVRWSTKAKPLNWETRFWRKVTRRWIRFHVHNHQATPVLSFLSSINAQWPTSVFIDSQSQPTGIMDIGYSLWTKRFHLLKNPLNRSTKTQLQEKCF